MTKNLYTIKIQRRKVEGETFISTIIDDGICQMSKRTDSKEAVLKFLKEEIWIVKP